MYDRTGDLLRTRRLAGWTPSVVLAALTLVSCRFNSDHLQERACAPDGTCPSGLSCCQGYCVLPSTCPRPYDLAAPELGIDLNIKYDQAPCAPGDPEFTVTRLNLVNFSAPAPFTPVEDAASWSVLSGNYIQSNSDGVNRAYLPGTQQKFLATAWFRLTSAGDSHLTGVGNMAGIVVRASDLATGAGSGYYCGVDTAKSRLFLAKTTGSDLADGKITLFRNPTDPYGEPGMKIAGGLSLNTHYRLTLRVLGAQLLCELQLPDLNRWVFSDTDTDLTSGSLALFTAGASAYFESVKLCE